MTTSGDNNDLNEFIDSMFEWNALFNKIKEMHPQSQTITIYTIGLQIKEYVDSPEFGAALREAGE